MESLDASGKRRQRLWSAMPPVKVAMTESSLLVEMVRFKRKSKRD
jgi:hypothetical protein